MGRPACRVHSVAEGLPKQQEPTQLTIELACSRFLADTESREVRESTLSVRAGEYPAAQLAVGALNTIVPVTNSYFFWSGNGETGTASGNWRRSLRKLFFLAGVDGGHPQTGFDSLGALQRPGD